VAVLPRAASATSVALLTSDPAELAEEARAALVGTGLLLDEEFTTLSGTATPALADLLGFDALLLWSAPGLPWDDGEALGDVLADYLALGGEVVLAAHALEDGLLPGGAFLAFPWTPLLAATAGSVSGELDLNTADLAHPAMAGLLDVRYGDVAQGNPALSAAGIEIASDTAGNLVISGTCDRSVLAVNLYPPGLDDGDPPTSPDAALLLAQAILATQEDAPPAAEAGGPYSVDEGGSVTLDASGSATGDLGPLSFAWDLDGDLDFDDGAAEPTALLDASTVSGPHELTVFLRVTDACGRSSEDSATVSVANVAPSIDAASHDGPQPEASTVHFSASASDPGAGDLVTLSWDFGDGSPPETGGAVEHAYADDGEYTVTVAADDGDGGTDEEFLDLEIQNVAPVLVALLGDGAGDVAETLGFVAAASDVAGAADPLSYTWNWGDGSPEGSGVDLVEASHAWLEPGHFEVSLRVEDGDGGSAGGIVEVIVSDPGPALSAISGPVALDEAANGAWSVTAQDALGEPVSLSWDFGDGAPPASGLGLLAASHAYADDGSYPVSVTATTTWGASETATLDLSVANVAPQITTSPNVLAEEGSIWFVPLLASDPAGTADPPLWTATTLPPGAEILPNLPALFWIPSFDQALAGPYDVEVEVGDGDGGGDSLAWSVAVTWQDEDGDGMPDTWEAMSGLDPQVDDGALDADGDGISNLDEWNGGEDPSDPTGSNAPGEPAPLLPLPDETVASAQPELRVSDAADPDGDTLVYDFEVWGEPSMVTLLASASGLAAGSGGGPDGETAWTVGPAALPEDSVSWWRARARDALGAGAWTKLRPFRVDATSEPPSVPEPLWPVDTTVATVLPVLRTGPVLDPEWDDVAVLVHLSDGVSSTWDLDAFPSASGDGTWEALPPLPLGDDTGWTWSTTATDSRGASSGTSDQVQFRVDVTNEPPLRPWPLAPSTSSTVETRVPLLRIAVAGGSQFAPQADPNGDATVARVQVDSTPGFSSATFQDLGTLPCPETPANLEDAPEDAIELEFAVLLPLAEDRDAFARARAEDSRGAASDWIVWWFHVDALASPPPAVRVTSPGDAQVVDGEAPLAIRWAPVTDPDGDPVTYELALRDTAAASGEFVWNIEDLPGPDPILQPGVEGETQGPSTLLPGSYAIRARALDAGGLAGPWGPENRFAVLPALPGKPVDLSPDGNGCTCRGGGASMGGGTARPSGAWLAIGGLLLLRTSRRRSPSTAR
jgi:PKD repeat protein